MVAGMINNSRIALPLTLAALLAGCGTLAPSHPEPVKTVECVNTMSYPELPEIPMPLEPGLIPWEYDAPRDMLAKPVPRNSAQCLAVAEKDRDDAYWERCGIQPVLDKSNLLYGFDERNWSIMLSDFAKLREYIVQLKERIAVANDERREYQRKAEAERRKATAAGAIPAAPSPASPPAAPQAPAAKQ
jgi:hypothetical protein